MKSLLTLFFLSGWTVSFSQTKIPLDSVAYYKNKLVTVCGPVQGTNVDEETKTTFFHLGGTYPNEILNVIIYERDLPNFLEAPVSYLPG